MDYTVNPGESIQDTITAAADDDQITVNDDNGIPYTYTENIVIEKRLTIKTCGTVTVDPTNAGQSVFRINNGGSGTTLEGFIISGVTDTTSFGAVHLNDASNCKITGNTIYNNWGGIRLVDSDNNQIYQNTVTNNKYGIRLVSGSTDNQIYENTVMDNTQYGISFTSTSLSGNTVNFNRIVGNMENGVDSDGTAFTINAENNWWGSNTGPGGIGSDTISTYVDADPWLVLKIDTNPTDIGEGETSTITADLTYNSDDVDTSASGNMLNGTPVLFTTDLGNVGSNSITKYTENGKSIATLTADEGTGTAHISAQVDNYITSPTADVNILPFTVYVNTLTGNDIYDGEAAVYDGTHGPKKTIQAGIDTVTSNGMVKIADGEYKYTDNVNITIAKNLTITGESQTETIINGTNNNWIFKIMTGVNVTICNLTLANGNTTTSGGAIQNQGNLTVINCTFTNNNANYYGGAIYNNCLVNSVSGSVTCTVTESNFTNNTAALFGGAIHNDCYVYGAVGSVTCTVTESNFTQNQAGFGGAISNDCYVDSGSGSVTCTVTESNFTQNNATIGVGGAIHNTCNISGSTTCTANFNRFYNNTATAAGNVISSNNSSVDVENNWWGINNPDNDWSQFLYSVISPNKWVQLRINAAPNVIGIGETSTITANLNYNNLNENLMATYGKSIPTVNVDFEVDSLGNLNLYNGIISDGNNLTTTFTAGQMPGTSTVNVTLDKGTAMKNIIMQRDDAYVATTGSDSNNGSSTNPFLTLEKAITEVRTGGRIHIANGEYTGTLNRGLTINKNITIFQDTWITGTETSAIINADDTNLIFVINTGVTVTLQNLTLTHGSFVFGGAILNQGILNILNCTFSDNTAWLFGGAIYSDGNLTISNSIFTGNSVPESDPGYAGGAICNMADMNITNCTFTQNSAGTGGAILSQNYLSDFLVTVRDSVFTENYASYYGGAFYIYDGDYTNNIIHFNRIVGNTAQEGNAIYIAYGSVNATLNWWGSNTDPSTINNLLVMETGCDVLSDPWLVLRSSADPESIYNGQISTVTANLLYDSGVLTDPDHPDLYYHNPVNGHVPDGIPVTFSLIDGPLGTLASQTSFVNGAASIIFTATAVGVQHVNATIDDENATATINIAPCGHVSITKTVDNSTPNYGDSITFTITAHNQGPNDIIGLEITDQLPEGFDIFPAIVTFVSSQASQGSYNETTGVWNIGTLLNGADAILNITCNITATGTCTNWANVTAQTTHDILAWSKDDATITVPAAAYLTIYKEFRDLPWGDVISTACYNDVIYAIVMVQNQGPDSTSVSVLDLFNGINWTGNYYVLSNLGSILPTPDSWELNDPVNTFNGTHWNIPFLNTFIGCVKVLAIEGIVSQTGTDAVSNYAETIDQSTYAYQGYDSYTAYLTTSVAPTSLSVDDVRGNKDETVTLKAVLTDYQSNPLSGETVEFWIDGVKVGESNTDTTGTAILNYIIIETPGNHVLKVVFNGNTEYGTSEATGELYVPQADLYITITSNKDNPQVGETFTLTYKLGNKGPDTAENVTITLNIPNGFVISGISGDGTWIINGNTIIWTLGNVTVGDPYLYMTGWTTTVGNYLFTASIASNTYNINTRGVTPITINAANNTQINANTIGMHNTGAPIAGMLLAILMVLGGFISTRKKQ
ncbi:hypothetical protein GCM10025860_21190 [Methanobacterium ferruginis]|nr:hypothetical protein GCM10025860_21190 [Methanobacterium ferruginis]